MVCSRNHPVLFSLIGPGLLCFFAAFILTVAFNLLYMVFLSTGRTSGAWLIDIAANTVFVLFTLYRMLFVRIAPVFYTGGYVPACSEADRQAAIDRAHAARAATVKLLDADYPARYCAECEHFVPPRTAHCAVCRRCVRGRDHHCMWLNTCVGLDSMRLFWQLCVNVLLLALDGLAHFALLWVDLLTDPDVVLLSVRGVATVYAQAMMTSVTLCFAGFMGRARRADTQR